MKNEILVKALKKAIDNGYLYHYKSKDKFPDLEWFVNYYSIGENGIYRIIFDKNFAKAFWGKEFVEDEYSSDVFSTILGGYEWDFEGERWQAHLMMMSISEDPIKYLEQFIK